MNADEEGFDLDTQHDGKAGGSASPAAPAPTPARGPEHPVERRGAAARPAARRAARGPAPTAESTAPSHGLPFLFRPGFLLVLGALVLAVLWAGGLFSGPDASADWPWTLFQTEGGAVTFTWDAAHVFTALGAFFAVFFLLTPFGPAIRSRGATVLTVAALGLVIFPPMTILDRMVVLLGLAAAAILAHEGLHGGSGRRAFVFVMVLLLGACLFLPIQSPGDAFDAQALRVGNDLFVDGDFGEVLLQPRTAVVLLSCVVFAVGLLSWIGLGGRWSVWVAGIALYLGVFGPMLLAWRASGADYATCHDGLRSVVQGLPAAFLAFTLPVAAGAIDAARS